MADAQSAPRSRREALGEEAWPMRRFLMYRTEDPTGVSGTGYIAEGIQFSDNTCVIRWFGEHASHVIWQNILDAMAIHGHAGRTRVEWID